MPWAYFTIELVGSELCSVFYDDKDDATWDRNEEEELGRPCSAVHYASLVSGIPCTAKRGAVNKQLRVYHEQANGD